jgi:hypothetical protein
MKLKKVEPRVTISVAHLHRVWLIPAFFLNFPKKILLFFFPLSISAKRVHWASYSDLLGFNCNVHIINRAVKIFLGAKGTAWTGNRELSKAGGSVHIVLNIFHFFFFLSYGSIPLSHH